MLCTSISKAQKGVELLRDGESDAQMRRDVEALEASVTQTKCKSALSECTHHSHKTRLSPLLAGYLRIQIRGVTIQCCVCNELLTPDNQTVDVFYFGEVNTERKVGWTSNGEPDRGVCYDERVHVHHNTSPATASSWSQTTRRRQS
jgi:hypothetical protein